MAKKKRLKLNGVIYDPQKEEVHISQLIRKHPSLEVLAPNQKKRVERYANEYMGFLSGIRIPNDVTDEVIGMIEEHKFLNGKNFAVIGEDSSSFALVKFGTRPVKSGLRIIYAHTDSPCLKLKVKPQKFEWDIDTRDHHLGVEISAFAYGGIHVHQWTGQDVEVCGYIIKNGRRKSISFPAHIDETSPHTDKRKEENIGFNDAHKEDESLNLISGHPSKKSLLKDLGFDGEEDFARSRLYAVKNVEPKSLRGYYITGYGHDDRVGVFAAVKALLESKPVYTTLFIGFDKEEVGSRGVGGAKGPFFEDVINQTLQKGMGKSLEDLTIGIISEIYRKSIAINADVDVGSTDKEIITADSYNIGKLGYGFFVSATDGYFEGDQQSIKLIDKIMTILKRKRVLIQTVGCPVPSDDAEGLISMNEFIAERGIETINCGIPVGSLHSSSEVMHVGDLYHAIKGYKAIIEDNRYYGPRRVNKKKSKGIIWL